MDSKKIKLLYKVGMAVCIVAFVSSGFYIASYYIKSKQSQKQSEEVRKEMYVKDVHEENLIDYTDVYDFGETDSNIVSENKESDGVEESKESLNDNDQESDSTEPKEAVDVKSKPKTAKITSKQVIDFQSLKKRNGEAVAWINIPDTAIDYPIVYAKKNNTKYLKKNFDGKEDSHGTLFFEKGCIPGVSDSNLLIYGHNMKDGSMFSGLLPYRQKTYLEANSYACMFTEDANYLYKAVVAFQTDVSKKNKKAFFFSDYIDLTNDAVYKDFKKQLEKNQLYKPVEEIKKGDSLLMLSTCEYSTDNGRLVVVFKRVDTKKIKK